MIYGGSNCLNMERAHWVGRKHKTILVALFLKIFLPSSAPLGMVLTLREVGFVSEFFLPCCFIARFLFAIKFNIFVSLDQM